MPELDSTPPEQLVARGEAFLDALRRSGQERLLASFEPVQKELASAADAQRRTAAEVQEAVLLRDAADERLDAVVADVSLAALELVGGDTGDPVFHSLFPEGPQVVTTVAMEEEMRLVRDLAQKLAGHPLEARFRRKLEIELEGVEQADRRLSHALSQEAITYAALRRATVTWVLQARVAESAARDPAPAAARAARRPPAAKRRAQPGGRRK